MAGIRSITDTSNGIADIQAGLNALGGARLLAVSPRADQGPAIGRFKLRYPGSIADGIGKSNATFLLQPAPEGGLRVIDSWKGGRRPETETDPAHLVMRGLRTAASHFGDKTEELHRMLVDQGVVADFRGQKKDAARTFLLHESLKAKLDELLPRMHETIARLGLKFEVQVGQAMGLKFTEIVVKSDSTEFGSVRSNLRDEAGAIAIGPSRQLFGLASDQDEIDLVSETVIAPLNYLVMLSGGEINLESGILADLKAKGLLTDSR